jgi:hypothetical protein
MIAHENFYFSHNLFKQYLRALEIIRHFTLIRIIKAFSHPDLILSIISPMPFGIDARDFVLVPD